MSTFDYDVVILGGGLAGLTLALQLRRQAPRIRVAVIEKSRRPLPDACHTVGESSVELGSHYFVHTLGLGEYLDETHLYKNGLRFFLGDAQGPLSARTEIGPGGFPPIPSFQIDRGRFESDLRGMVEQAGIDLLEGLTVTDVELGGANTPHRVLYSDQTTAREFQTRWVVDATGRRRLIQRKLGLGRPSPITASSSWFRVAGRVDISELVPTEDQAWHRRDLDGKRWLSTNHLCGRGYWVWIIPLSTDHTSIGIAADTRHHDFTTFHEPEKALDWLRTHEPRLAERLEEVPFLDFHCLRDYAHLSSRVFSEDGWACVGEAGVFVDPLYSPGSDLIALANTFTTRLVLDDLDGTLDPGWFDELNDLYFGWGADTGTMLGDYGDTLAAPEVFSAKVWFDFHHYWSFICPYFIQGIYRLSLDEHRRFHAMGKRFFEVNARAQRILRAWATESDGQVRRDHVPLPQIESALAERHSELGRSKTPAETMASMEHALARAEDIVHELVLGAISRLPMDRLEPFAEAAGLHEWGCTLQKARVDLEPGRGPGRRQQLGQIARDMERALGRPTPSPEPLAERLTRAGLGLA